MRTIVDMSHVVNHLVDLVIAREKEGKKAFVAIISEGVAEFLPQEEIKKCISMDEYQSLKPDTFGHFPVSQLKYSSRLGRLMAEEYKRRTGNSRKFNGLQFGYEVRCNQPTAYDVIVGSQIGVGCYRALCEEGKNGVMISVNSGSDPMGLTFPAFEDLINMSKLRAYQRPIKVGSDMHKLARYLEAWK
jgi:6-phosphofructokinase 1